MNHLKWSAAVFWSYLVWTMLLKLDRKRSLSSILQFKFISLVTYLAKPFVIGFSIEVPSLTSRTQDEHPQIQMDEHSFHCLVFTGLNILICTPGRLLQHMDETPNFDSSAVQILVLDEADRILDMVSLPSYDTICSLEIELPMLHYNCTDWQATCEITLKMEE